MENGARFWWRGIVSITAWMTVINQVCTPFCTLMVCFPTYHNVKLLFAVFTPCTRLFHYLLHVSYHRIHHKLQAFIHILINFQRHTAITYFNQTHILYVSTTFHGLDSQESTIIIYFYESICIYIYTPYVKE